MAIKTRFCNGFLLLVLMSITWSINAVLPCEFGPGCLHECHCAVSCDSQTGCTGQCAAGWDGPTCQRQNVALNRTTTQSSTYSSDPYDLGSHNAVDGRIGHNLFALPCTHTKGGTSATPATWSVTLDRVYRISRFKIYNRVESCGTNNPCARRLAGFTLSVGNSSSQIYRTCYTDPTADGISPGHIITKSCNQAGPLSGNIVQISAKGQNVLALCEVLIYVCSAGSYGPDCGQTCGFCAQGRKVCDTTSGHCPHRPNELRCQAGYSGETCKIVCSAGSYGPDCGHTCGFCARGRKVCDTTSGHCPQRPDELRCQAGYSGDRCKIECNNGKWGSGCVENCGHCRGGVACAKSSGACPAVTPRCSAGYKGTHCNTTCSNDEWGADCLQSCHCHSGAACDKSSGVCPAVIPRCSAGYMGQQCNTECDDGNWGVDCQQTCGHCDNKSACNKTSGYCPADNPRCSAGYSGTMCETRCANGTYGPDCAASCGFCALGKSTCNTTSGDCPGRSCQPVCVAGYIGAKCKTGANVTQQSVGKESNTAVIIGCAVSLIVGIIMGVLGYRLFLYRRQSASETGGEHDRTQMSVIDKDRHVKREGNHDSHTYNNEVMDEDGSSYENAIENIYDRPRLSQEGPEANYTTMS